MSLLSESQEYFSNNRNELFEKYPDKWLVISGEIVAGPFDTDIEAEIEISGKYRMGTYFIVKCTKPETRITEGKNEILALLTFQLEVFIIHENKQLENGKWSVVIFSELNMFSAVEASQAEAYKTIGMKMNTYHNKYKR